MFSYGANKTLSLVVDLGVDNDVWLCGVISVQAKERPRIGKLWL